MVHENGIVEERSGGAGVVGIGGRGRECVRNGDEAGDRIGSVN